MTPEIDKTQAQSNACTKKKSDKNDVAPPPCPCFTRHVTIDGRVQTSSCSWPEIYK
jgi:hypothetical protein